MMRLHKSIAGCLGIGHIKGGGSIAAFVACVAWWFAQADGVFHYSMIAVTGIVTAIGTWSATRVEPDWGKDSNRVVIDEVAGMFISLLFIPVSIKWIAAAFVLFRFFDILKPLYIRNAEALPAGWGVMADDVLAGIYANLLLQLIIYLV
ncbi:MAG: phosphatidylglycerophosphatase A [Bacteroidota bacterium]